MIEKPAQVAGYSFESRVVEDILDQAGKEPGCLPLVAYTLKQLFEDRQERTFTRKAFKGMGGVTGAIGTKADQVMKGLAKEVNNAFERVFAELVHLERHGLPTRKRAALSHFHDDVEAVTLIQELSSEACRVLVTDLERTNKTKKDTPVTAQSSGETIEVAHEKLFTDWPRLRDWI